MLTNFTGVSSSSRLHGMYAFVRNDCLSSLGNRCSSFFIVFLFFPLVKLIATSDNNYGIPVSSTVVQYV
uniref:Uncharacterized protein n=1 Tax=Rhizophora mucronata TaxID=61149 RepID=A0A2P2PLT5_RHIMU